MECVYLSTRCSAWRAEQKENKLQKNKCIPSLVTDIYLTACHKQKMWIKGRKGKEGAVWVQGICSALHQGSLLDQGTFCHFVLHQASCEMVEPNAEWVLGMGRKTTTLVFLFITRHGFGVIQEQRGCFKWGREFRLPGCAWWESPANCLWDLMLSYPASIINHAGRRLGSSFLNHLKIL